MKAKNTKIDREPIKRGWLIFIPAIELIVMWKFYSIVEATSIITTVVTFIGTGLSLWLLNLKKDELLQGVWTSLGILGTFISLVLAFHDSHLFMENDGKLQLENLLPYLSSAFITSVIGISAGVFFSFRYKFYERKKEKSEEYLQYPIEKLFYEMKIAIDNISNNISQDLSKMMVPFFKGFNAAVFENMKPVLEQSTKALESLNTKIETQFSEIIKSFNIVTIKMDDIMKQQGESTRTYVDKIEGTLNELVGKLSVSLDNAFEKNIKELDRTFRNLNEWQNLSKIELETITSIFRAAIEQYIEFKDSQSEILVQVKNQLMAIDNIRKTKSEEIEIVQVYDKNLTDLIDKVKDISKVINQLDSLKNKLDSFVLNQGLQRPINGSKKINGNSHYKTTENVQ